MKTFCRIFFIFLFFLNISNTIVFSQTNKSEEIAEKALKPVGLVVGGSVAPMVLVVDYSAKTIKWCYEDVAVPVGSGIYHGIIWSSNKVSEVVDFTSKYTIEPIFDGIEWSTEKILLPSLEFSAQYTIVPVIKGIIYGSKYTIIPIGKGLGKGVYYVGKGVYWGYDKTIDGLEYGARYVLIPIGKGMINGVEFVVVPVGKGIMYGAEYTVIPIGKCIGKGAYYVGKGIYYGVDKVIDVAELGAKYTIVPIGKGIEWSYENIATPIGHGIQNGTMMIITPINNSVKSTINVLKFWDKKQ